MQTYDSGHYQCRVTRWAMTKAKSGTPQFTISFVPLGKVNMQDADGELEACPDFERTIYRPVTEKTAAWLLDDLKTLFEYPHEKFSPLDPDGPDPFDFSGKEFRASLVYEDYEGKSRERWNFVSQGSYALRGEPLPHAELRRLDSLYGKAAPKPARTNGKKGARKPEPINASVDSDDNIPF